MPTIAHESLRQMAHEVYVANNTPEDIARAVSDYQVETNLAGHDSHGILSMPRFVNDIRSGKIVPDARPSAVRDEGPTALYNGNRSFGQYCAGECVTRVIDKGKQFGIGAVGITNCNHVGALWGYVKRVVDAGLVGLVWSSAGPRGGSMAPFGGTKTVLAGNPIGFGVPAAERPPLVTDISTATAAGGKVLIALQNGESIPGDWVFDADGNPTTDPAKFVTPDLQLLGAMRPFGEHKGYALALFAEVLGGILTGYGMAYQDDYIEGNGTFLVAIDPGRFVDPAVFRREVDAYFEAVKSVPTNAETEEILIPGEMEARTWAEREKNGIPIPEGTWQTLVAVAEEAGVPEG